MIRSTFALIAESIVCTEQQHSVRLGKRGSVRDAALELGEQGVRVAAPQRSMRHPSLWLRFGWRLHGKNLAVGIKRAISHVGVATRSRPLPVRHVDVRDSRRRDLTRGGAVPAYSAGFVGAAVVADA